jgi:hypothetical protein
MGSVTGYGEVESKNLAALRVGEPRWASEGCAEGRSLAQQTLLQTSFIGKAGAPGIVYRQRPGTRHPAGSLIRGP